MKGWSDNMDATRVKNRCSDSLRRATVLTVVMASILCRPVLLPAQGAAVYVYDGLGRVVGVVSPTGDAAVYTYDATGNVISISRYSNRQVSIMTLAPYSGPVNSTVTVYGTGFSTTATQNVVKFNGTQASVVSASNNTIVTKVPTGATTGSLTVTTPAGSASSNAPFTVKPAQAPTISSFTPKIGAAGTALTIAGTNFQPTVASDTVRLNGTVASVDSAASSQIHTSVTQGATSGHISVATPFGQATSTADFFAPPSPYTASQVGFTGRMSLGKTSTLGIQTAGDVGLMIFDETSGHRVSLAANNSTFATCGLTLSILSPSNLTVDTAQNVCSTGFLSTPVLTENGTYTIFAKTSTGTGQTGTVALSLYDIPHDFSSSITAGGSPVDVSLTIPGQMARLTFAGTSGQNISVNLTKGTFPFCSLNLAILNPDGSTLNSTTCVGTGGLVSQQILPMAGTYTILLTTTDASIGSITVALYDVTNVTGTITIGGPAVQVKLGTPGQIAKLTFSGTAAQTATVHVTNNTIACVTVGILNPGGTTLFSELECTSNFNLPSQTLPTTGKYTLSIVPSQADTGSLTVEITSP
jgi:YD repeat-containing protein